MTDFDWASINRMTGGGVGVHDVACPLCLAGRSARGQHRRVLRIYAEPDWAGWHCARCDAKGYTKPDAGPGAPSPLPPERLAEIRRDAAQRASDARAQSIAKAQWLWGVRRPITPNTPAWTYLRMKRRYEGPIPGTLGFIKPTRPDHHPAIIAAIGFAEEPEPGEYAIRPEAVRGVHLILLRRNGGDKAQVSEPKLTIGQGSAGTPICLFPPNDLLGIVLCEGIEEVLSVYQTTGLGAWAAGGAGRLAQLGTAVPNWIDTATILQDPDSAGSEGALKLWSTLIARGINAEIAPLAQRRAA